MKMKSILLVAALVVTVTAHAEDSKIRQGLGVSGATSEQAAMKLIKGCLAVASSVSESAIFVGIEDLKFTNMPDGTVYAGGKCVIAPSK